MKYFRSGFTLIEILVVISIVVIMSAVTLASYNSFTDSRKLDVDTQKLMDVLELARQKADAGDSSIGTSTCGNLNSTEVRITTTGYTMYVHCMLGDLTQPYYFDSAITLPMASENIVFPILHGTPVTTPSQSFILENNTTLTCQLITVTSGGTISNQSVTCPPPN